MALLTTVERDSFSIAVSAISALPSDYEGLLALAMAAAARADEAEARLADILPRIADHPTHHLEMLLPWHWKAVQAAPIAEAA